MALALLLSSHPASAEDPGDGKLASSFFHSKETRSENMKPFKKWTEALQRYSKESAENNVGSCDVKKMNTCHYAQWMRFLEGIKSKDRMTQVTEVNKYMNTRNYITDQQNWGQSDYWETPGEFMARFGDCEDYAISKFMSLKLMGFSDDDLRVVAVKDLNLKVGHAVLVVFVDGKTVLLDNQIKQVVDTETVKHYEPVFSINEKAWWRHRI